MSAFSLSIVTSAPTRRPSVEPLESRRLMSADPVLVWNDVALAAIREAKSNPPVATRNLAMLHATICDVVQAFNGKFDPMLVDATAERGTNLRAAIAAAANTVLTAAYPAQTDDVAAAYQAELAAVKNQVREDKGVALGNAVGTQVIAARATDGASTAGAGYVAGTDIGDWQPTGTPPGPLLPGWGNVTPFAMTSGSQFRSAAPPEVNSIAYTAAYNEVKAIGSSTSPTRTVEQTEIALFWADGGGTFTPPGHWNQIAHSVSDKRGLGTKRTARLFALVNCAMFDAGVACWDTKFAFNYWRPVTGIRAGETDGNADTVGDAVWAPLIATPPFPAYTSGHSTFSSAAATVLGRFFGKDEVRFTSVADNGTGIVRRFDSFSHAADEAAVSRVYGGIHWSFDSSAGAACGELVGNRVMDTMLQRATA